MDKILEQVAFNLSSLHDFSPEFVAANEKFALAVIKEFQAAQSNPLTPVQVYEGKGYEDDPSWYSAAEFANEGHLQIGDEFELTASYFHDAKFKVVDKDEDERCIVEQIDGQLYASAVPQGLGDPVAYLHRLSKTTELSFFGESANCTANKDWIGCIPLYAVPQPVTSADISVVA